LRGLRCDRGQPSRPTAEPRDRTPYRLLRKSIRAGLHVSSLEGAGFEHSVPHDKLNARETIPTTFKGETMNWTERRERFRAILSRNRCVHPGSVYDAISARIAEDLGFEVGMFSGSIGSMSVLGTPDLVVLTLTEFAEQANRICRAGNLALLVDADHGYGNANVRRTVEGWRLRASAQCRSRIRYCRGLMVPTASPT
jgi:Phosphoenolpyruvate phosphomutase